MVTTELVPVLSVVPTANSLKLGANVVYFCGVLWSDEESNSVDVRTMGTMSHPIGEMPWSYLIRIVIAPDCVNGLGFFDELEPISPRWIGRVAFSFATLGHVRMVHGFAITSYPSTKMFDSDCCQRKETRLL